MFGAATLASGALGLLVGGEPRLLVLSGSLGAVWLAWDLLIDYLLGPMAEFAGQLLSGDAGVQPTGDLRPSLEDTIRLLESHINSGADRHVQVNAALRLEEIYRTVKKDPQRAQEVVHLVHARFPDARELLPRER